MGEADKRKVTLRRLRTFKTELMKTVMGKTESVSWSALKTKRDDSKLVPGQWYRITDYVTKVDQAECQSANHQFDVIVRADEANKLSEHAFAARHEGDSYFANSKLEAWELLYCLDNDTYRFYWADSTNGKGVIYWMRDEHGNECGYDFKNVQYKRYKITAMQDSPTLVGQYLGVKYSSVLFPSGATISTTDTVWRYTFDHGGVDMSLNMTSYMCHDNVIGSFVQYSSREYCQLNNIVFLGESSYQTVNNKIGGNCRTLSFGAGANHNVIKGTCTQTVFGKQCNANSFAGSTTNNTFGDSCVNNTIGQSSNTNIFGSGCYGNKLGFGCSGNLFGENFQMNTLDDGCADNTFGDSCMNNTLGKNCRRNVFKAYVITANLLDSMVKQRVNVSLNCGEGNIIDDYEEDGDDWTVKGVWRNYGSSAVTLDVTYKFYDSDNDVVDSGSEQIQIGAASSKGVSFTGSYPTGDFAYCTIEVSWSEGGKSYKVACIYEY